jgi:hypothetical protein
MTDKNYPPFSKGFYDEIEEEVKKIIREKSEVSITDFELIKSHLKCLNGAVQQYTEQIKEALIRIEKRDLLEAGK